MARRARRSIGIQKVRTTEGVRRLEKATGSKMPRRASVMTPSLGHLGRTANRIHLRRAKAVKMKGAHALHDSTGRIHAMTGAHLANGHLRPHSAFTHLKPYKIPKGMHPRKRLG